MRMCWFFGLISNTGCLLIGSLNVIFCLVREFLSCDFFKVFWGQSHVLVNATSVKKCCEIRFTRSSVGKNLLKDHRSYVKPINDSLSQVL